MIAPYRGQFQVTQTYNPPSHRGLDLVGIDSKTIYSTIDGVVVRAGWENPNDHSQGWGQRIVIKQSGSNRYFYFGHLDSYTVVPNDIVALGQIIGIEGNTGHSTGSHLHYECRLNDDVNQVQDISAISGIPNAIGIYNSGVDPDIPDDDWSGRLFVVLSKFVKKRKGGIL